MNISAMSTFPALGGDGLSPSASLSIGKAVKNTGLASNSGAGAAINNYVSGQPQGEDRYIKATQMAAQGYSDMRGRQNSILAAGMNQALGDDASYAEMAVAGRKAARSMELDAQRSTLEGSRHTLDDMISDIEERATEAANPEQSGDTASAAPDSAASTPAAAGNAQSNKGQSAPNTPEKSPESVAAAAPVSNAEQAAPKQTQVDIIV